MLSMLLCTAFTALASGASPGSRSQPPEPKLNPTQEGACAQVDWACTSRCVDRLCANECLGRTCVGALDSLARCAQATCEDAKTCSSDECKQACISAYGAPTELPEATAKTEPCATIEAWGAQVEESVAGRWELDAASVAVSETQAQKAPTTTPRSDFKRWMLLTPKGCWVQETTLTSPTVKPGNEMLIRVWGTARQKGKTVWLETHGGQALGQLCGQGFVSQPKRMKSPQPRSFEIETEKDTLTLTATTEDKQTFRFQRLPKEEPASNREEAERHSPKGDSPRGHSPK